MTTALPPRVQRLAIPLLAIAWVVGGCGSGAGVSGGRDAAAGDTWAAVPDAADSRDDTGDAPTPDSFSEAGDAEDGFCKDYVANSGKLDGKSAADFCDEYQVVCKFGALGRYADRATCLLLYMGASPTAQSCRAGHLCYAKSGSPADHCPHAAGLMVSMCM